MTPLFLFSSPEASLLLGSLVGLSRATEGNEHKVTAAMDRLVLDGLATLPCPGISAEACPSSAELTRLAELSAAVHQAKRQLIPLCFDCAAPCGRNEDYDPGTFAALSAEARALRLSLLTAARALAKALASGKDSAFDAASSSGMSAEMDSLYSALYALGRDDWEPELLQLSLTRLQQFWV